MRTPVPQENLGCFFICQSLTKSIQIMESDAKVDVNVDTKIVTVEAAASEESIK
ncbi:MAG: hypothetical protein HWQ41_05755 [Nostoc sp. NOS(2021)]|uniref:hypothetical protein n=1 Tax=Nostoc sp. NOS(2021) TaxID=2815407 RepID=UPI002600BA84|nr:hypothetical protein [Nostoc sp. NOS(2021)]MBN3894774.1 hypothetical protein [Nostoc sp. NOS(2021)]